MFILYALIIGIAVGLVSGGRLSGLSRLSFRWAWVFFGGLATQVVLFSDQVTERIGSLGVPIYVLSTALVLLAVLANRATPGMPVVALGAASNLAAIVSNGGYMPASAGALAALGKVPKTVYSNSALLPNPVLAPLTDIFALPHWLPWANIFSIGDLVIGLGVVIVIVVAMRRPVAMSEGLAGGLSEAQWRRLLEARGPAASRHRAPNPSGQIARIDSASAPNDTGPSAL